MKRIVGEIQLDFDTNSPTKNINSFQLNQVLENCFDTFEDILEQEMNKVGITIDSVYPFLLFGDVEIIEDE